MSRKIVVVGGLAAGPAAASKAKRIDSSAEIILLEKSRFISYGICELPFYISNSIIDYKDLLVVTPEKFQSDKGVEVRLQNELKEIDQKNREIIVFNSGANKLERINYDKLILSLGSIPARLTELPDTSNSFQFKFMDDGIKLKSYLNYNSVKTAVIFGAGFVGLELAEALSKSGIKVVMFGKDDLPMSYFDIEAREKILHLLNQNNIEYIKYSSIDSYNIREEKIDSIEIDGNIYETDIIITAIGVEPNTFPVKGSGILTGKKNGILVDRKLKTSVEGIYACGDCCELTNKITLKQGYFPFANIAQKTGWIAGENAANGMKIFRGVIPAYCIKIFETEFSCVGLSYDKAIASGLEVEKISTSGYTKPRIMPGANKINSILIYTKEDKKIIGAELFGKEGCALRTNILSAAIEAKMNLSDIADLDMVYHPLTTPQRDIIQYCAMAGLK